MKFKIGDNVIKCTGGNKMIVVNFSLNDIDCIWFSDNFHQAKFKEEELIYVSEYKNVILIEKRDDLISRIIN